MTKSIGNMEKTERTETKVDSTGRRRTYKITCYSERTSEGEFGHMHIEEIRNTHQLNAIKYKRV